MVMVRYDLEERTLEFGKRILHFCKALPGNTINWKLIDQLVRSGTSVGANYREANETQTKKEFRFRIRICRKEAKETLYWLQLILEINPSFSNRVQLLLKENEELLKIFAAIAQKAE